MTFSSAFIGGPTGFDFSRRAARHISWPPNADGIWFFCDPSGSSRVARIQPAAPRMRKPAAEVSSPAQIASRSPNRGPAFEAKQPRRTFHLA
jgi:hypothetical protein